MDLFIKILIFAHFIGLVLGMGSGIALANVGRIAGETGGAPEGGMAKLGDVMRQNSHVGLAILWISGPLLVWLNYGGVSTFGFWFWLKMAAVVVLSAAVGMSGANYKRIKAGQAGALERNKAYAAAAGLSSVVVVFAAVMSFN